MYKLCFYVPETHLALVKQALFAAGAGKIGNYDCCAWQTLGQGQFRPVVNSQPFTGKEDELETIAEYKVEMVCADELIQTVIAALRAAHPYKEPAFDVWPLAQL